MWAIHHLFSGYSKSLPEYYVFLMPVYRSPQLILLSIQWYPPERVKLVGNTITIHTEYVRETNSQKLKEWDGTQTNMRHGRLKII